MSVYFSRGIAVLVILVVGLAGRTVLAYDLNQLLTKDLKVLTVPDNKTEAAKVIKEWLESRGFDCQLKQDLVVMTKRSVLINLQPLVFKNELDRIHTFSLFIPKDEYKNSPELERQATILNRKQNFFQVFIANNGDLAVATNLTFYDDLHARLFDVYMDLYVDILNTWILTEETKKYLK